MLMAAAEGDDIEVDGLFYFIGTHHTHLYIYDTTWQHARWNIEITLYNISTYFKYSVRVVWHRGAPWWTIRYIYFFSLKKDRNEMMGQSGADVFQQL